jgi:hypothetical protein
MPGADHTARRYKNRRPVGRHYAISDPERGGYFVSKRIRKARKPAMSLKPCGTPGGT